MVLKVDMWHKGKYYIIGIYEDLEDHIYPSHFNPIIAEKKNDLYRRWNYSIKSPYQIKLNSPVGVFKKITKSFFLLKRYTTSPQLNYLAKLRLLPLAAIKYWHQKIRLNSSSK